MSATAAADHTTAADGVGIAPAVGRGATRVGSIDIIRGAVMVLMAVDHVRVFAGVPAGGPAPGVFFTRWITHFCAPAFVFLAGTAAFLHGQRLADRAALARWLFVRGAWLVLLELTVLRFSWTFNFDYAHYMLAGVIWMIGICMMLMSVLVRLPVRAVTVVGVAIILLHNVTDLLPASIVPRGDSANPSWWWQVLYLGGVVNVGGPEGPPLAVLYSIFPWVGVMAAGYGFGQVVRLPAEQRRRVCYAIGLGAIALFIALRALDGYGDPRHWSGQQGPAGYLRFLNTTKYPASLLFLLMTLGPAIALVPVLEGAWSPVARWLTVFGRVPMFYYLLHIPLIHLVFVALSLVRFGTVIPWLTDNHPMFVGPPPDGYMYSLGALYAITLLVVVLLYLPCRWYARVKAARKDSWLTFL